MNGDKDMGRQSHTCGSFDFFPVEKICFYWKKMVENISFVNECGWLDSLMLLLSV